MDLIASDPKTETAPGSRAASGCSANAPLKAEVEGDRLVISIGIETLAWASKPENGGTLEKCKVDGRRRREWAKDVTLEMLAEDGLGQTPLGEFLDSMMEAAADSGSAALNWPNDPSSATGSSSETLPCEYNPMKGTPLPDALTSPGEKTDEATGSSSGAHCSAPSLTSGEIRYILSKLYGDEAGCYVQESDEWIYPHDILKKLYAQLLAQNDLRSETASHE